MKKIFVSIGILLFVTVSSLVQAQGVGVGIKAGANFANQSISFLSTDFSTDARTGFLGGVYLTIEFSDKWGIQPEVFYSMQGSEIPDFDDVNKFDYLSVPILLRYKPISFLSIEAGPQFSSLLSVKDINGDSYKDEFKKSDFGLALGATVHLPLGLNAGMRYVWGFTNVSDVDLDSEVKNTVFQIYAGWTLLGGN